MVFKQSLLDQYRLNKMSTSCSSSIKTFSDFITLRKISKTRCSKMVPLMIASSSTTESMRRIISRSCARSGEY